MNEQTEQSAEVLEFETDDWVEALAFLLLSARKMIEEGEEPAEEALRHLREILEIAHSRGWEFTGEQTLLFCLDGKNSVESVAQLPEALELGNYLTEDDFESVFECSGDVPETEGSKDGAEH